MRPRHFRRSWSNVGDDVELTNEVQKKRKRKSDPSTWKRNVNMKKKLHGNEYQSQKKDVDGKWKMVDRPAKKRGPRCLKPSCGKRGKKCNVFSDDDCEMIFTEFWSCGDAGMQNTFIKSLVDNKEKTCTTISPSKTSRRKNTKAFRLKNNGITYDVCKEMFLNTLGISKARVDSVMESSSVGISATLVKPRNPHPSRGFTWTAEDQQFLSDFFQNIPKAPSHYCRSDSTKIFLDVNIVCMTKLHSVYEATCKAAGKHPFSIFKFTEFFKDNNYSIFKRKKDLCNTCVGYELGNISLDQYNEHIQMKEEGFTLKEEDKKKANNIDVIVVTADTEALLTAPFNDANIMFIRSKLNLHNFTFYNLFDKDVLNFLWSEVNGDLEASSFTSCFVSYLELLMEKYPSATVIVFWTDGCPYQNRNAEIASALANFSKSHQITIYQKYLEVGHTHMECDSVHSNVEKAKKKDFGINLPADYIRVIKGSRKNPYGVKYCELSFFKNYKAICDLPSIKPVKEQGRPYIVDIRQLKYTPDGTIYTNLTYDNSSWNAIPYKFVLTNRVPVQKRHTQIKLPYSKWKHLQEICEVSVSKEYHYFYNNLPHNEK